MTPSDQQQHSNIVVAIDAELNVLERRVTKLRELRRQALELDNTRLPRAAAAPPPPPPRPRATKKQSPRLTVEDVLESIRDLLGDGPTTNNKIHRAIGRSPTPRSKEIVESALEQIGARVVGHDHGGPVYGLRSAEPEAPSKAPAPAFADGLYVPNGGGT